MNIKKLAKSLNIRHNGILFIILLVGAGLMLFPSIDKKDSEAPPKSKKTVCDGRIGFDFKSKSKACKK